MSALIVKGKGINSTPHFQMLQMNIPSRFEQFFIKVKQNRWIWLFSIFCRVTLSLGFLMAGYVKIIDERFASGLSVIHPMGSYLNALHHTGYYYTFIGIAQILAAVFLLIPRMVFLGALIYFPIILNIFILSYSVRFVGSLLTSPLMLLANIFLLCWHYDRLKFILPIKNPQPVNLPRPIRYSNKFPFKFVLGSAAAVAAIVAGVMAMSNYAVMPENSVADCVGQFKGSNRTTAAAEFCDCVHNKGLPLDTCLANYEEAPDDKIPGK